MRVTPDLILTGFFWLPAKEPVRVPGTVTVTNGGDIHLELLGAFDQSELGLIPDQKIPRIVGRVEMHGFVTLEQCNAEGQWRLNPNEISKTQIRVHHLFLGVGYEEQDFP